MLINSDFPLYGVQRQLHYQFKSSNAAEIEAHLTKLALSNLLSNFITIIFVCLRFHKTNLTTKHDNKLTVGTLNI
jgi:hypothetical protein